MTLADMLSVPVTAMGRTCAVHKHREDVPIVIHHIWPKGKKGPDVGWNKIALCANAHGSVHDYMLKIDKAKSPKAVPWRVRRRYGYRVRQLAERGWAQYGRKEEV